MNWLGLHGDSVCPTRIAQSGVNLRVVCCRCMLARAVADGWLPSLSRLETAHAFCLKKMRNAHNLAVFLLGACCLENKNPFEKTKVGILCSLIMAHLVRTGLEGQTLPCCAPRFSLP